MYLVYNNFFFNHWPRVNGVCGLRAQYVVVTWEPKWNFGGHVLFRYVLKSIVLNSLAYKSLSTKVLPTKVLYTKILHSRLWWPRCTCDCRVDNSCLLICFLHFLVIHFLGSWSKSTFALVVLLKKINILGVSPIVRVIQIGSQIFWKAKTANNSYHRYLT